MASSSISTRDTSFRTTRGATCAFSVKQEGGPTLRTLGGASLFTPRKPVPEQRTQAGPSAGKSVLPGDFAGRFQLQADGRWSGLLELEVPEGRRLTGRFLLREQRIVLQAERRSPLETKATFTIAFPRTEQVYEAFLWTEGKNAMAGTFTMQGRTYGFVATRESGSPDTDRKTGPARTSESR